MSKLHVYDNWERLVDAVIDREKLRHLAFCDSFSSTSSSAASISRLSSVSSSSLLSFNFAADTDDQVTALSSSRASVPPNNSSSTQANPRGVAAFLFSAPRAYFHRRRQRDYEKQRQRDYERQRDYDLFVSNYFFDVPVDQLDQVERFSLPELQLGTDNFSNKNILGRGGFGKVYKCRLADGSLVAVKRLKEERTDQGEKQFQREVKTRLNMGPHPNLLQLRGFCLTQEERLLVYPFLANGSVASCLRERPESKPPLDWPTRKRIALTSAKGLAYLHDGCDQKIVHRDVKAANILLDEDLEAVVGDFGLAEFMDDEDAHVTTHFESVICDFSSVKFMDHEDTHVTTSGVHGTLGHIAPEYVATGKISDKTDVFAYGIMLLELITAQTTSDLACLANDDDVMLLDWVKGLLKEKKLETVVDADLQGNYIDEEVEQLIQVALLCTQGSPNERPKMSDVVSTLEGDGLDERWEQWQNEDMFRQEFNHAQYHPNTDWLIADSTPEMQDLELSGPR